MKWKLACMLIPYKTTNPMVGFSKYEFNNKLLGSIIFFRIISGVTWTQPYISLFDVNFDKFTIRLYYLRIFFMFIKFQGD